MTNELKQAIDQMVERRMKNTGEDRITAAMCIQHYLTARYLHQNLDEAPNY